MAKQIPSEMSKDVLPFGENLVTDLSLDHREAIKQFSGTISPFIEQASELDASIMEGVRRLEGWRLCNITSESTSDISTVLDTTNGGVVRIILMSSELPAGLSEAEVTAYVLKYGTEGIAEYYAPDAVKTAREADHENDTEFLLHNCEPTTWSQLGYNFDSFLWNGDPALSLMQHARFVYAERQIEAFTHFNETYAATNKMRSSLAGDNPHDALRHTTAALGLYSDAVGRIQRGDFARLSDFITESVMQAVFKKIRFDELATDIRVAIEKSEDVTLDIKERIFQASRNFSSYFTVLLSVHLKLEKHILLDHKTYRNVWNEGVIEVLNSVTTMDGFGQMTGQEDTYQTPRMAPVLQIAISKAALLNHISKQPPMVDPPKTPLEIQSQ